MNSKLCPRVAHQAVCESWNMRLIDNSLGEFVTLQFGSTGENLYSLDASQTEVKAGEPPLCAESRPGLIISGETNAKSSHHPTVPSIGVRTLGVTVSVIYWDPSASFGASNCQCFCISESHACVQV